MQQKDQEKQGQPVSSKSIDRLRAYLRELTPRAQALLTREFELALTKGQDTAVANFVLKELRAVLRPPDSSQLPRLEDLSRLVFASVEPFLVDAREVRRGQVRRSSILPLWNWLASEGIPAEVVLFEQGLAAAEGRAPEVDKLVRQFQIKVAEAIGKASQDAGGRTLARIGGPAIVEDIHAIATLLTQREPIENLRLRLPAQIRSFADSQVASVRGALEQFPTLQKPDTVPYALSAVMQRMHSPWQIIRLAISVAGSDEEARVAATPFGISVAMALHDLAAVGAQLRSEVKRGQFEKSAALLKSLHDGVRDFRTELGMRSDSSTSRQLAAIRIDISNTLKSEIESVPGRVRRLLRQRSDKDINAGARLDTSEVEETAGLINFVAICRTYASELALNEVTQRAYSDLQQYIEKSTEALVQSLRAGDARVRAFRQVQAEVAIRFCEVMFGNDYAALMNKALEVALSGERKPSRAG